MKTYTNHTQGLRGIREDDGSETGQIHWIAPGASIELKKVKDPLPDLGEPGDNSAPDAGDFDMLRGEIDSLKAQLETETARADDAEKLVADASTEIDSLKAQIAKFDPDGDGKTGGSKPAAPKA